MRLEKSPRAGRLTGGADCQGIALRQPPDSFGRARDEFDLLRRRGASQPVQGVHDRTKELVKVQVIEQGHNGVGWGFNDHDHAPRRALWVHVPLQRPKGRQPAGRTPDIGIVGIGQRAIYVETNGLDARKIKCWH